MKSSLGREQIGLVAGAGLLVLAAALLGWLGLQRLGEVEAEAQVLAEKMGNPALASLLADPSGPGRANRETVELRKLKEEVMALDANTTAGWAKAAQEAAGAGQEWSKDPGKWKDRLIEIQSRLQKEAPEKKVVLKPDFYLGLEEYRQRSPTEQEVPGLAVQLSVATRLVEHFFQARQAPEQYPTVCEILSLSGPASPQEKPAETPPPVPAARPAPSKEMPERKSFRVEIRCSPEVLYDYVRRLTQDSWLLILTDLELANAKQKFPLRSEIAKSLASGGRPESGAGEKGETQKKLLEILAGEESVTAALSLDFVSWKETPAVNPAAPASP